MPIVSGGHRGSDYRCPYDRTPLKIIAIDSNQQELPMSSPPEIADTPYTPVAGLPCTLAEIGYAVQALLVSSSVAPLNRVIFSRKRQPFPASGYPQIIITRQDFELNQGMYQGGNRYATIHEGMIEVTVNSMSQKDMAEQDQYRLMGNPTTNPAIIGLEQMALAVINTLHGEFVANARGDFLTVEPLRMDGDATPVEYDMEKNPGWEGITMRFRAMYFPTITVP
jgi:hypothetical protein